MAISLLNDRDEMIAVGEPCDHAVGICWCSFYDALNGAMSAIHTLQKEIMA